MDNVEVAKQLVRLAKQLSSGENEDKMSSGLKKRIQDYIKEAEKGLREDKYANSRMKITGPGAETMWMNVSLADLEAIAKALK